MEDIGATLLRYIEANNYTQTSFAKKMNISLSTLNKYILNKRQIPLDNLIRFAIELNFSLDYILGIMNVDNDAITKPEYELILKLRKLNPKDFDIVYTSISNLLEVIERNEQNKWENNEKTNSIYVKSK